MDFILLLAHLFITMHIYLHSCINSVLVPTGEKHDKNKVKIISTYL